jgi:hypothetical protein
MNIQDQQKNLTKTNPVTHISIPPNQIYTTFIPSPSETYQFNQNKQDDIPESSSARNSNPHHQNLPRSFLYDDSTVNEGVNICQCSIIGKIITDKPIHVKSIQNGLESIWGSPPGLKIQALEGKLLQFFVNDIADHDRIIAGNPWLFRNAWLVANLGIKELTIITWTLTMSPFGSNYGGFPLIVKQNRWVKI